MRGDVLWPLLFGSALTLGTTLATQWFSLTFQTGRQREARQADFQRTTLIQVRDLLSELTAAEQRLAASRYEAAERTGQWELGRHHPDIVGSGA